MTNDPLVSVFSTGDIALLTLAKATLDGAGIKYTVQGEYLQNAFGAGALGLGYNGAMGPMLIQVLARDSSQAFELLNPLKEDITDEP